MAKQQDLVVKMTVNSTDFEKGLTNAKASMKKFDQSTLTMSSVFKNAMGAMTKAFAGLGIAMGATEMFKSFMNSTQTLSDGWQNAMTAAKTSFEVFQLSVVNGSGVILSNFKQSIAAAREFAQALDSFGSAQISNKYARMSYVTPFNEAMTKYREMKSAGNITGMAFAASEMQRYLNDYSNNASVLINSAKDVVTTKLSAYTGGFINSSNINRYIDQLYLDIINGVFPPILQDFKNLDVERKKGDYFYNKALDAMTEKYGEGWRREAEAMNNLSEINDDTLNEMLGVLQSADQVRNEINSMRRQMNKVVKGEETTVKPITTPTTSTGRGVDLVPTLTPISAAKDKDFGLETIEKVNRALKMQGIIMQENQLLVAVENQLWQQRINEMNTYASVLGQVSSSFSSLASIAEDGSPWQKFATMLGSVSSQISSLISTYSSLVAVESVAESIRSGEGIPFPYNLAAMAAAAAAIAGIIASAKSTFAGSYAEGGIVPGTSYTGDKLWARVNSGELIVPERDWRNGLGGGQVKFVIEGSQLKGVLDNYETIQNM